MSVSITVPEGYGSVLLVTIFGHLVVTNYLGAQVMKGREKYGVGYPNCYATPGFHKEADAFNRLQRGHHNFLEQLPIVLLASLVGGLKHPKAVSVCGVLHCVGSILYQAGYADTSLDVKHARYKKGGVLKHVGIVGILVACGKLVFDLMKKK
jgi:glutathione S-transferase